MKAINNSILQLSDERNSGLWLWILSRKKKEETKLFWKANIMQYFAKIKLFQEVKDYFFFIELTFKKGFYLKCTVYKFRDTLILNLKYGSAHRCGTVRCQCYALM